MAQFSNQLSASQMSKVTDIVSAENSFRFCAEYLGIDCNEFKTIEYNEKFIHHDTLFKCIELWKNRTEGEGQDARQELIELLYKVLEERGWFTKQDLEFLTDGDTRGISTKRMSEIRDSTKASLKRRLQKSLSNDWIPETRAHAFPLRDYYVQLNWSRKLRTAMETESETFTSLQELIKEKIKPVKIQHGQSVIIEGGGGIGKSSSLGMLALDWAEDRVADELKRFSFVFLILLRHVNSDECMEAIIIQQHGQLKTMKVTLDEMKHICEGKPENVVMYIFDGFDEYTVGTNSEIDEILKNGRQNSFVIISSRPGDFLQPIRRQSDEEVSITGFSKEHIFKCATTYLGHEMISEIFLDEAMRSNMFELLHIPIILLMACAVFKQNKCLPENTTQLFGQIVDMSISRTTLKTMTMAAKAIPNLEDLKVALGKLAWKALNRQSKQLLLFKDDVIKESEDLLKLGLLFGQEADLETEDFPEVLSFQHKLIQEYLAAFYIAKQVENDRSYLETWFPDFSAINSHLEVLKFTCGLLAISDATPVTNHAGHILANYALREFRDGGIGYRLFHGAIVESLQTLHKEGCVSSINQFLCLYPSCGYPLSEAIQNSRLVIIQGVDKNDSLQLAPSSVPVIVNIIHGNYENYADKEKEVNRLMKALSAAHINLQCILSSVIDDLCKLNCFSELTSISYEGPNGGRMNEKHVKDLTASINSWGVESQLRVLRCSLPNLSDSCRARALYTSFVKALSKCMSLELLTITCSNQADFVPALMGAVPPGLECLGLGCGVSDKALESITRAVRQKKLQNLNVLGILVMEHVGFSPPSETVVISLVKSFVDVRPDKRLEICFDKVYPEIEYLCKPSQITISHLSLNSSIEHTASASYELRLATLNNKILFAESYNLCTK